MSAISPAGASPPSSLKRNSMVNLLGSLAPMLVSLLTLPPYLRVIGDVRFGVLTLVWLLFGYFLFVDMGLGRAMAHHIAKAADAEEVRKLFWTGVLLNGSLGLAGGVLLWGAGVLLLGTVIKVPPELLGEVRVALPWLALAMPLATAGSVLNGALEGRERFVTLNALGVVGSSLSQLAPLAIALAYGPGLGGLVAAVTAVRVLSTVLAVLTCRHSLPPLGGPSFDRITARHLLGFGGWITVSGVISPILTTLDRLMIGAMAGAQALTHYSVPFSLISRAQVIPGSVASTLFPRFSQQDQQAAGSGAQTAIRVLASVMTPLVVLGMLLLRPFLEVWVGSDLAAAASPIGTILLIGIWVNSLAWIPFTLLQGLGRPDLTAKIHALEVLPYLLALGLGLMLAGPRGAAWAWTLRVAADLALLFRSARLPASLLGLIAPAPAMVLAAWVCTLLPGGVPKLLTGGGLAAVSLGWSWHAAPEELRSLVVRLSARLRFA